MYVYMDGDETPNPDSESLRQSKRGIGRVLDVGQISGLRIR